MARKTGLNLLFATKMVQTQKVTKVHELSKLAGPIAAVQNQKQTPLRWPSRAKPSRKRRAASWASASSKCTTRYPKTLTRPAPPSRKGPSNLPRKGSEPIVLPQVGATLAFASKTRKTAGPTHEEEWSAGKGKTSKVWPPPLFARSGGSAGLLGHHWVLSGTYWALLGLIEHHMAEKPGAIAKLAHFSFRPLVPLVFVCFGHGCRSKASVLWLRALRACASVCVCVCSVCVRLLSVCALCVCALCAVRVCVCVCVWKPSAGLPFCGTPASFRSVHLGSGSTALSWVSWQVTRPDQSHQGNPKSSDWIKLLGCSRPLVTSPLAACGNSVTRCMNSQRTLGNECTPQQIQNISVANNKCNSAV